MMAAANGSKGKDENAESSKFTYGASRHWRRLVTFKPFAKIKKFCFEFLFSIVFLPIQFFLSVFWLCFLDSKEHFLKVVYIGTYVSIHSTYKK